MTSIIRKNVRFPGIYSHCEHCGFDRLQKKEGDSRMSTVARSSGISSARSSFSATNQSIFDDDVVPVRSTTPIEARVPEQLWYMRLLSELCDAWENVRDLWRIQDCWSKIHAIVSFVYLPVRVIRGAASSHDNIRIPDHASVSYLFVLMCFTFVVNLVELDGSNKRRDVFVAFCMVLAIPAMFYLYLFTKDRVRHDPCHNAPIRIFFRGGLYIFGFLSILNSICLAINMWSCQPANEKKFDQKSAATVQFVKALFVVTETLFLGYFHKACFPLDTALLQISLAHILGTNFALWFWTLCEETKPVDDSNCKNSRRALELGDNEWSSYEKYFYPVFVEYLILALAILYELWINLRRGQETLCRFCKNCARCLYRSQNPAHEKEINVQNTSQQRYIPRCSFGIILGTIYAAVFFVLILFAISDASNNHNNNNNNNKTEPTVNGTKIVVINYDLHGPFIHYCYGSFLMYLSMISACYIILASLRSPNSLQRIRSFDYDDVLLYISLMGILVIEGFHVLSKIIAGRSYVYLVAVDISGIVQHLTQVVTLMNLGHYPGAIGHRNRAWICECILFLLLTNLAWWVQDSFYLDSKLTRPGEISTIKGIEIYGTIVKPMVIFFRFHSVTYFYNTWTLCIA